MEAAGDKRCGTCRHFTPYKGIYPAGRCDWLPEKLPYGFVSIERHDANELKGQDCPCYDQKETVVGMPPGRSNEVDSAVRRLAFIQGLTVDEELKGAIKVVLDELERLESEVESAWEQAHGEDV